MSEKFDPMTAQIMTRADGLQFTPGSWDAATRTIGFVVSAGARGVQRNLRTGELYDEELACSEGSVDTTRVDAGVCTVQADHGQRFDTFDGPTRPIPTIRTTIGRVLEGSIKYENGVVTGRMYLTTAEDAQPIVQRIIDGTLRGISPGYVATEYTETPGINGGRTLRTVTRWLLWEVSVTPIPMDSGATTRSTTEELMADQNTPAGTPSATPAAPVDVRAIEDAVAKRIVRRQNDIVEIATRAGINLAVPADPKATEQELKIRAAYGDTEVPVETVRAYAFDILAKSADDLKVVSGQRAEIQRDEVQTRFEAVAAGLSQRMGLTLAKEDAEKSMLVRGLDPVGLAGECLVLRGMNPRELAMMSREDIVHEAFHQAPGPRLAQRDGGTHMTGDLTSVFSNVIQKEIRQPSQVSDVYSWFEKVGRLVTFDTLDDRTVVEFGGLDNLEVVGEGAEYKRATIGDSKISYGLVKFGKILPLTEEMFLKNGGLAMFAGLLIEWINSSVRTRSAAAADALISNPLMGDGKALFTAGAIDWDEKKKVNKGGHANLSTSGGVPTIARLNELDGFLFDMVDRAGNAVGSPAEYFIGARSNKAYLDAIYDPKRQVLSEADSVSVVIPEANRLYVPSLRNEKKWMLATGDRGALEFGYLDGANGPVVSQHPEHKNDSIDFKCKLRFAVRATRFEKVAMNPGQ